MLCGVRGRKWKTFTILSVTGGSAFDADTLCGVAVSATVENFFWIGVMFAHVEFGQSIYDQFSCGLRAMAKLERMVCA